MKKLFKLGLLSLLMGSLVVTSGCYKKDIDDLEERLNALEIKVTDAEDAIDILEGLIAKKGVVSSITEGTTDLTFVVNFADGTPSKTINIPYTVPTAAIIKTAPALSANGRYIEFEIYSDNKQTSTYIVRMGVYFDKASGVEVLSESIRVTAGMPAYAIVDVNPSSYPLEVDKLDFDEFSISRAAATGLPEDIIEVAGVYRASLFAEGKDEEGNDTGSEVIWNDIVGSDAITALEGRWVIEFNVLEQIETADYKLLVEFPVDCAAYNGIWASRAAIPAEPTVATQYVISDNMLRFRDRVVPFTAETEMTLITNLEDEDEAAEMYSDETVNAIITLAGYDADPNVYIDGPNFDARQEQRQILPGVYVGMGPANYYFDVTLYDELGNEVTPIPADQLAALRSYLVKDEITIPNPAVDGVWKNVEFSMIDDEDMSTTHFPVGYTVEYTFRYYANSGTTSLLVPQTITTNYFTLSVTRLLLSVDLEDVGAMYIPTADTDRTFTAAQIQARLAEMGYSDDDIEEATFEGLGIEVWDDVADDWVAYTGTVEAFIASEPEDIDDDLTITAKTTVPVGKYRLTLNYSVAGRDVVCTMNGEIVAPTIYVKLDAAYTATPNVTYGTGDIDAVVVYVDDPDGEVEVADLLNLVNVKLGATLNDAGTAWIIGSDPTGAYAFKDAIEGNTYGIKAVESAVAINEDDEAVLVKLSVELETGQILPVIVNESMWTYNLVAPGTVVTIPDWTNGNFYVAALANSIEDMTLKSNTAFNFDMVNIIPTAVDIEDALVSITMRDGEVITFSPALTVVDPDDEDNTFSPYAAGALSQIMNDGRFTVKVETVPIDEPLIQATELITVALDSREEAVTGSSPEFNYTHHELKLQGINAITAWNGTVVQQIKITVTDQFGEEVVKNISINLTHSGS